MKTSGLLRCRHCRHRTALSAGTIFAHSKLALTTWFLAMYLLTQQKNAISALELKRQLGVSYPSAWSLKHKPLQTMLERDADRQLAGVIEIDDADWGGESRGQTPGRGSPNKTPFVAALRAASVELEDFRWLNTVLGNVKNALHGACHKVSPRHLPRYLAERG